MSISNCLVTLLMAVLKLFRITFVKIGTKRLRKSAPTRLNDKPKYMHWPRIVSYDVTPRSRSVSRVTRKFFIFSLIHEWKTFPLVAFSLQSTAFSSSANVALYWVIMLNRLTRLNSIVFTKWCWAVAERENISLRHSLCVMPNLVLTIICRNACKCCTKPTVSGLEKFQF